MIFIGYLQEKHKNRNFKTEKSKIKARLSNSVHMVNDPRMDDLLMIKAYTNDIFKLNINFNDILVQKVLMNNNWTQE